MEKIILWIKFVDINLIVVSEKITKLNPVMNVANLSFWYLEFSFELIISKNEINDRIGKYIGITNLL